MVSFFRLLIAFSLLCYFHYIVVSSGLDIGGTIQSIAYGALLSVFASLFYIYGKWFLFIYKNTRNKYSLREFFLENILLPVSLFFVFGFPILGLDVFNKIFFIFCVVNIVLLFDARFGLSNFLWKYRFKEFSSYPENGIVKESVLKNNRALIFSFFIFIPFAGYIVKSFYP